MAIVTEDLLAPFRRGARIDPPLAAFFLLIHGILLVNAILHDPRIGYDGEAHLLYIEALSGLQLPSPADTPEYYSPPLPYAIPALLRALGLSLAAAAKAAQFQNVVCSLVLAWCLLAICDGLRPGSVELRRMALSFLGILPVYYKTFSQVRGEPMLAAAVLLALRWLIRFFIQGPPRPAGAALLGAALGAALLSRQGGFLAAAAVSMAALAGLVWSPGRRVALLKAALAAAAVCALVSGWFYGHLTLEHGTQRAFGRGGAGRLSLPNQPPHFYLDLGLDKLFRDPVRPSFPNRLLPTFYSETWGDYWCYFLVYGKDRRDGRLLPGIYLDRALEQRPPPDWLETNRHAIAAYLGRVNLAGLPATAFLLAGCLIGLAGGARAVRGAGADARARILGLLVLLVACTLAGYFWFLLMYPSPEKGRTIKPTYVLQVFPPLCLLAAETLFLLAERSARAYRWAGGLLIACGLHNLPALFTRSVGW